MIDRDAWAIATALRDQREQEARDRLSRGTPQAEAPPEVAPDTTPALVAPPEPVQATRPAQPWGSGEWGKPPEPDVLDDVPEEVQRILAKLLGLQGDDNG
jgi:hypothetical protein